MSEQGRNETFPRIERIGETVFIHVLTMQPPENAGLLDPTAIADIYQEPGPDYTMGTELRFHSGRITRTLHPYEVFLPIFRTAMRMACTKSPGDGEIEGA